MASKALSLCLLLYCFAPSTAQSGSGETVPPDVLVPLDAKDCDGAKAAYDLPIISRGSSLIFDEMRASDAGSSICRSVDTCCSKSAEQDLAATATVTMSDRVLEIWQEKIVPCRSILLKDALASYANNSKNELLGILIDNFRTFFTQYDLFDDFYAYLQQAILTGNSCELGSQFNIIFFKVFLTVLDADPGVDTSLYPNTPEFDTCLYNYYISTNSEGIHTSFVALTRSFNRTLYYLRALDVAEELLDEVAVLDLTPQCKQSLMKMTYCAQCSGFPSSLLACEGLCLNTLRGCLVDYSELYKPFMEFTRAAIHMKEYLDNNVNLFTHISQLHVKFLDVIRNTQRSSRSINQDILLQCNQDGRQSRETKSNPRASRALFPRSTVTPPTQAFNNSAYCLLDVAPLFRNVPETVCEEVTEPANTPVCWNGNTVGSYEREVLELNRTAQQDNPELIVCSRLPHLLRVHVTRLRQVTREMNIISRSESCPEDDEDCSVDDQRCDYTLHSTVVPVYKPSTPSDSAGSEVMDDMEYSGSGYGSGSGSSASFGSGDCDSPQCAEEEEEAVEACLLDSFTPPTSPVPSPTPSTTSSTTSTETTPTSTSSKPPSATSKPAPEATPITPTVTDRAVCITSSSVLYLSLLFLSIVFSGVL